MNNNNNKNIDFQITYLIPRNGHKCTQIYNQ